MNDKLKEGDRVYCIFNHAIKGEVTKKACYHGLYLYTIRADDAKNFKKFLRFNDNNVVFLQWQLGRIYVDKS